MKMNLSKAHRLFSTCLIIIASLYLTWLVDLITLNTWLKRIFVFVYFCTACSILLKLRKRFLPLASKKVRIVSILLSLLLLLSFQNFFLPTKQEGTIILRGAGQNSAALNGEIWLVDAKIDGEVVSLDQLSISEISQWSYSSEYDDYLYNPTSTSMQDNWLCISTVAQEVELGFLSHSWSGIVDIETPFSNHITIDLFSENPNGSRISYNVPIGKSYTPVERIIFNLGALVVLYFLLEAVFIFIQRKTNLFANRKNKPLFSLIAFFLILFSLFTSILLSPQIIYNNETYTISITASNEKNAECEGYEVHVFPQNSDSANFPVVIYQDDSWTFRDEGYLTTTPNSTIVFQSNSLSDTSFSFSSHKYAAKVRINSNTYDETIDLYSEVEKKIEVPIQTVSSTKSASQIFLGIFVLIIFTISLCFFTSFFFSNILSSVILSSAVLFVLCFNRFKFLPLPYNLIFSICIICIIYNLKNTFYSEKIFTRKICFIFSFASLLTSFILFGYDLFLSEAFINITLQNIVIFINIWLLINHVFFFVLHITRKKQAPRVQPRTRSIRYNSVLFSVISLILITWCIIFYPANMTSDNSDQWFQALG